MDLLSLKFRLSEADANRLVEKHLPADVELEKVKVRFEADAVVVQGEYPFFLPVPFETRWQLGTMDGMLAAKLLGYKAMGIPGTVFKSVIVKIIEEMVKKEAWIQTKDDVVTFDLSRAVAKYSLPCEVRVRAVKIEPGSLTVLIND